MAKRYVTFGISFLIMSTAATLLLTWSLWWLFVVPNSVPARRPFFHESSRVPTLIEEASDFAASTNSVFVYSLPGGWPTLNSALRITAAIVAIVSSFSFAFIATFTHERTTRSIFTIFLAVVTGLALAVCVVDSRVLHRTRIECNTNNCTSAIPDDLPEQFKMQADSIRCRCSPDAWFWVTLGMDIVLALSALICLVLTIVPWIIPSKQEVSSFEEQEQAF